MIAGVSIGNLPSFGELAGLLIGEALGEMESTIADPHTREEDIPSMREDLESMTKEWVELEHRILGHFTPRPPHADSAFPSKVDHEAKTKIEKGLADVKAGTYEPSRDSKTGGRKSTRQCRKSVKSTVDPVGAASCQLGSHIQMAS